MEGRSGADPLKEIPERGIRLHKEVGPPVQLQPRAGLLKTSGAPAGQSPRLEQTHPPPRLGQEKSRRHPGKTCTDDDDGCAGLIGFLIHVESRQRKTSRSFALFDREGLQPDAGKSALIIFSSIRR